MLGLSSSVPADLRFSVAGFMNAWGERNKAGWGVAAYPQPGAQSTPLIARVVKEPQPMHTSPAARSLLEAGATDLGQGSCIYLVHARSSSGSPATAENTHPFERQVWDRSFVLAHDGSAATRPASRKSTFSPRGQTDSEKLFCEILDVIVGRFPNGASWSKLHIAARCNALHLAIKSVAPPSAGQVNLLLSDGELLFYHSRHQDKNSYYLLRAPASAASARHENRAASSDYDFAKSRAERSAIVVAGEPPNTEAGWQPIPHGESIAFRRGEVVFQSFRSMASGPPKPPLTLSAHG
jgi:glutamine amidotransferase